MFSTQVHHLKDENMRSTNEQINDKSYFNLAQTYSIHQMHEKAIEFHKLALNSDESKDNKFISCMEIYDQYEKLGKGEEGLRFLVESFRFNNTRIECIYRLIKWYCIKGMPEVSYNYYQLIKDQYESNQQSDTSNCPKSKNDEFDFYLPYYMIIVSERTGHYDTCFKMYEIIFEKNYLLASEWWIHNLFHNIQFIINAIPQDSKGVNFIESMLQYVRNLRHHGTLLNTNHWSIIDKFIEKIRPNLVTPINHIESLIRRDGGQVKVMMTITTCKRFDLFEQTVNSILNRWKDINKIDYFFCVDDNSSEEDRRKMRTQFPFFNYHMKSADQKGHRESMNIIWKKLNELKPTYWIHLEDDWLYFKSESFITEGISLLNKYESLNVHQIVFNRAYGLMMSDMARTGLKPLETGVVLHERRDGVTGPNCAYWPHYSLQPSIVRTRIILELGNYDSPNSFFERDYADKYWEKGYKTAFFDFIFSLHIGKQHWEKTGMNAYALNQTEQFKN
jgi:hypothetical protein